MVSKEVKHKINYNLISIFDTESFEHASRSTNSSKVEEAEGSNLCLTNRVDTVVD